MLTPSTRWFRFGLGHMFVLTLGIAIGFTPFKLWELGAPPEPAVMVHMQIVEVPRAELPALALDERVFGVGAAMGDANDLPDKLESLCQARRVKMLSQPTIMTLNGQPASVLVGQEFPFVESAGDDATTISYKEVGLRVDVVPTILRNGRVRLALAPRLSELDHEKPIEVNGLAVPSVRTRSTDATVEADFGSTFVLAGLNDTAGEQRDTEVLVIATVERAPAVP